MLFSLKKYLYLFGLICFLSASTPKKNSSHKASVKIKGHSFFSQKFKKSDIIKVWLYKINRSDLEILRDQSKFGLASEDDLVNFIKFVYFHLKAQNMHHKYVDTLSVQLLLSFENAPDFNAFYDPTNKTLAPKTVINMKKYVVSKSEANAKDRMLTLSSAAKSNWSSVEDVFYYIGSVATILFPEAKKGKVYVYETEKHYEIYVCVSNPTNGVELNNNKSIFKEIISFALTGQCIYVEN